MAIIFGRAIKFDNITLDDIIKNPIWVTAHDERHDEEYEKPILNCQNLSQNILNIYTPIITFKIMKSNIYGSAYYSHQNGYLFAISVWVNEKWITLENVQYLKIPFLIESLPSILGFPNVKFKCNNLKNDRAYLINWKSPFLLKSTCNIMKLLFNR